MDLLAEVEEFEQNRKILSESVRGFIQDRRIPLKIREDLFIKLPSNFLGVENWSIDLPNYENKYGDLNWYDDFNIEKYQTCSFSDLIEMVRENGYSEEQVDLFIEDLFSIGSSAFIFNW